MFTEAPVFSRTFPCKVTRDGKTTVCYRWVSLASTQKAPVTWLLRSVCTQHETGRNLPREPGGLFKRTHFPPCGLQAPTRTHISPSTIHLHAVLANVLEIPRQGRVCAHQSQSTVQRPGFSFSCHY